MCMQFAIFSALLLMTAIIDIRSKKIPNSLILCIVIMGLNINFISKEGLGLLACLAGFATGFFFYCRLIYMQVWAPVM